MRQAYRPTRRQQWAARAGSCRQRADRQEEARHAVNEEQPTNPLFQTRRVGNANRRGRFLPESAEFNVPPGAARIWHWAFANPEGASAWVHEPVGGPGAVTRAREPALRVFSSAEEALERLVHQECWPDQGLENGEQALAARVGLRPEEHQRTDQAQAVYGASTASAGLTRAALAVGARVESVMVASSSSPSSLSGHG